MQPRLLWTSLFILAVGLNIFISGCLISWLSNKGIPFRGETLEGAYISLFISWPFLRWLYVLSGSANLNQKFRFAGRAISFIYVFVAASIIIVPFISNY